MDPTLPGMSPDQVFWLAVLDRVVPVMATVISGVLTVAMAYLAYLKTRQVHREVGVLSENVNGKMQQLLDSKDQLTDARADAARAEGKLEGVTQVTPEVVQAVSPLLASLPHGESAPGKAGRRTGDPPRTTDPTHPPS